MAENLNLGLTETQRDFLIGLYSNNGVLTIPTHHIHAWVSDLEGFVVFKNIRERTKVWNGKYMNELVSRRITLTKAGELYLRGYYGRARN